jgi:hypothetical protein
VKSQIQLAVHLLGEIFGVKISLPAVDIINSAGQQLTPIKTVTIEGEFPAGTSLKGLKIQEFENEMEVFQVIH